MAVVALTVLAACGKDEDDALPRTKVFGDPTASYPVRHITVEIRPETGDPERPPRTRKVALERAKEIVAKARAPGADFKAIANELSEDRTGATDGGFGGFVAQWQDDDPAIVRAAQRMKVGEVSDPVESRSSIEILQLLSRDEGKAEEARVLAPVEGVMLAWKGVTGSQPTPKTKEEAYADAAKAVIDLRAGNSVDYVVAQTQAARPFSAVLRRGLLGAKELTAAAFESKPNVWLDPIATEDGWAVARRRPYARTVVRHLVVTHQNSAKPVPKTDRTPEAAHAIATKASERLTADPASWDRVVLEMSDEPSSRGSGGFIGEIATTLEARRRMAPEIEEAVLALAPGARSGVVESRFGFHIFWRVD